MPIDASVIEDLKAKHGEIYEFDHEDVAVVVKRPGRPQWKRFRSLIADERRRPDALETLLRDCLVYPGQKELDAFLDRYPAVGESFGGKLAELAGLTEKIDPKAL